MLKCFTYPRHSCSDWIMAAAITRIFTLVLLLVAAGTGPLYASETFRTGRLTIETASGGKYGFAIEIARNAAPDGAGADVPRATGARRRHAVHPAGAPDHVDVDEEHADPAGHGLHRHRRPDRERPRARRSPFARYHQFRRAGQGRAGDRRRDGVASLASGPATGSFTRLSSRRSRRQGFVRGVCAPGSGRRPAAASPGSPARPHGRRR